MLKFSTIRQVNFNWEQFQLVQEARFGKFWATAVTTKGTDPENDSPVRRLVTLMLYDGLCECVRVFRESINSNQSLGRTQVAFSVTCQFMMCILGTEKLWN